MKERPILFRAPMVRSLLSGAKTQTRRVVKQQPHPSHNPQHAELRAAGWVWMAYDDRPLYTFATCDFRCPYGQPGDRLWVRESFIHEPADYCWEASVSIPCQPAITVYRADVDGDLRGHGWTPSIHMPRWASRITLEVTGVRVERLQDISADDCWAEGIVMSPDVDPVHEYQELWEQINGSGSWDANPWVWAIEFKRI